MRCYYDNCSGGGRSAKSKQLLGYLRVCGIQIYICTNMLNISVECRMDVICRQVGGRWMETWNESLCPKTSESRAAMRKKICSLSKKHVTSLHSGLSNVCSTKILLILFVFLLTIPCIFPIIDFVKHLTFHLPTL